MTTRGWGSAPARSRGGLEPVQVGHADVHEHEVGPQVTGAVERDAPVGGLADHREVGLGFEDHAQTAADQRFVVGDQDPDHCRDGVSGSSARTA
jgi:hypothetical protein